ncbi:helix-turn-helix domain-containing protein, partial [Streptococcus thermophilus]|nr:helix-turn-helix domain-containing protein [Streptococcus thermophilus]
MRLSKKSFNQVERDLGYPRNALHNYKNGVEPSGIRLIELAHYFGVTPEYLLGISNDKKKNGTRIIF